MTKPTRKLGIAAIAGMGLLLLTLGGAQAKEESGPSATQMEHETVVVIAIDRAAREVTLQNDEGENKTIQVPKDVEAFDTLKVGDHIDIDYMESIAVSMLPPGTKPSMSESTSVKRMGQGRGASGVHETSVSGTVVSVDPKANRVTFRGPRGNTKTINVANPEMQQRLPSLRPGQVVKITYTQGIAAAIRKH